MKHRYTPPSWLRHITPWWLLYWIDKRYPTCWHSMFMWKEFGGERSWWPEARCFDPYDYCNKFPTECEQKKALGRFGEGVR